MGLDVYVGSFTRYYSGDWETVVARMAREQGMDFHVIRTDPSPPDAVTDPAVISQAVGDWRSALEAGLRENLPEGLAWDERAEFEYFTDKPDWLGYSSLLLLAAHTTLPQYALPERATSSFNEDSAYQRLAAQDFCCPFSQLFEVEVWLPCAFQFTFLTLDLTGNEVRFGSSVTLLEQLRHLNAKTNCLDSETLAQRMSYGAGTEDGFLQAAQFGLAIFLHLTQLAVTHHLPMKLDY